MRPQGNLRRSSNRPAGSSFTSSILLNSRLAHVRELSLTHQALEVNE